MPSSSVTEISKCIVYSEKRSTVADLRLSVSDLPMLTCHYIKKSVLLTSPPPSFSFDDLVSSPRHSLSSTLSRFPALAGRFSTSPSGHIYITCNDSGVELIAASTKHINVSDVLSPANSFVDGKFKTELLTVGVSSSSSPTPQSPPKSLLVATPVVEGEYPVVMLLHGYLLYNSFYSQLMLHVSSHGFIVIAPQLYSIAGPDTKDEIKSTAEIIDWLSVGLHHYLPPKVTPNLSKFAISGHSRGGKTAFALALKKYGYSSSLKISALIGIDPVDGAGKGKQTPPPVLTYEQNSFDLDKMPVLVIGSGLGEIGQNLLLPPCAPPGVNHKEFFQECQGPAWHFVAKDYGHMDMLDDDTKGIRGETSHYLCKNGKERKPMRRFVGGSVVAFLMAYLEGDNNELVKIKDKSDEGLLVEIQESEVKN